MIHACIGLSKLGHQYVRHEIVMTENAANTEAANAVKDELGISRRDQRTTATHRMQAETGGGGDGGGGGGGGGGPSSDRK